MGTRPIYSAAAWTLAEFKPGFIYIIGNKTSDFLSGNVRKGTIAADASGKGFCVGQLQV
jgi:hypothetical protein